MPNTGESIVALAIAVTAAWQVEFVPGMCFCFANSRPYKYLWTVSGLRTLQAAEVLGPSQPEATPAIFWLRLSSEHESPSATAMALDMQLSRKCSHGQGNGTYSDKQLAMLSHATSKEPFSSVLEGKQTPGLAFGTPCRESGQLLELPQHCIHKRLPVALLGARPVPRYWSQAKDQTCHLSHASFTASKT